MLEVRLAKLSIEQVVKKADVGKTTVYRRWKTKEELVSEAFGSIADKVQIPILATKWKIFSKSQKE